MGWKLWLCKIQGEIIKVARIGNYEISGPAKINRNYVNSKLATYFVSGLIKFGEILLPKFSETIIFLYKTIEKATLGSETANYFCC